MFTGLVADLGEVRAVDATDDGVRLRVGTALAGEVAPGDSVAINGVCLTAVEVADGGFSADVVRETLDRSSLGAARDGGVVNVELPLRATDRLGGHVVQGHVDGTAQVTAVEPDGFSRRVTVKPDDRSLMRYVVEKGSITVDGVSLTVASVTDDAFAVALIPETLDRTNLGRAERGTVVNLEVDVLAKYVERLVNHT